MSTQSYRQVEAWKHAHELVLIVYKLTSSFPEEEKFGLVSQMRRAAVSVPANIAEGYRRIGDKDKLRFFNIAQASLSEVDYFLLLTNELGFADTASAQALADRTGQLLVAYSKPIARRVKESPTEYRVDELTQD